MTKKHVVFEVFSTRHCVNVTRSFNVGIPHVTLGVIKDGMHAENFGRNEVNLEATITRSTCSSERCLELHFVHVISFIYLKLDGEESIFSCVILRKPIGSS